MMFGRLLLQPGFLYTGGRQALMDLNSQFERPHVMGQSLTNRGVDTDDGMRH